ncbi:MAG: peptidylprolyl isomerase [Actinomycetota bacterium]|nr:peptidylprolyl isomerase [Actinomycetota bacterium]
MPQTYPVPPELDIDPARAYSATMETSKGTIELHLYAAEAPRAVNNFVFLARGGFYDGVVFHRVIEGFMIQGGDPTGTGRGGPGYRFEDELDLARRHGYPRGTLAMANAGPDTQGSQFFIVQEDASLSPDYTVFGRVVEGMNVVDAIATTPTDRADRPLEEVRIEGVAIHES